MVTRWFCLTLLVFLIFFQSCDSTNTENQNTTTTEPEVSVDADNPLLEIESARRLAAFLPASIDGIKGGRLEGWTPETTPGVKYTMVKRAYRDLKNKTRIDLSISDAGKETLRSLGLITYWLGKRIDKKTEDGHEKNVIFDKYPAYEKCGKTYCDLYFATGNRFLIGGHIERLPIEKLHTAFQNLQLTQLEQLPK